MKNLPVTYWIIGVLFVVMVAQYLFPPLTAYGAIYPELVLGGQMVWGVFTNMFLHAGFPHFIFNAIALLFFGTSLERIIGGRRLVLVFLASGIFASIFYTITSVFIFGSGGVPALGASGAVAGVIGALVVYRPNITVVGFPMMVPMPLWAWAVFFLVVFSALVPGVAWTAHLGGLIAGLLFGLYFRGRWTEQALSYTILYR